MVGKDGRLPARYGSGPLYRHGHSDATVAAMGGCSSDGGGVLRLYIRGSWGSGRSPTPFAIPRSCASPPNLPWGSPPEIGRCRGTSRRRRHLHLPVSVSRSTGDSAAVRREPLPAGARAPCPAAVAGYEHFPAHSGGPDSKKNKRRFRTMSAPRHTQPHPKPRTCLFPSTSGRRSGLGGAEEAGTRVQSWQRHQTVRRVPSRTSRLRCNDFGDEQPRIPSHFPIVGSGEVVLSCITQILER